MKTILIFSILILAVFTSHEGAAQALDSAELKFLAQKIQEPAVTLGIFELPDENSPLKKMKSGIIPEENEAYINAAINKNILKLYTVRAIKGEFDSMIFMPIPAPDLEEAYHLSFYSYPGTTWLLFLEKKLKITNGTLEASAWTKEVGDLLTNNYLNEQSAFSVISPFKGNYFVSWPKDINRPLGIQKADADFVEDLTKIVKGLNGIAPGSTKEEKAQKLQTLRATMKSRNGRIMCFFLEK